METVKTIDDYFCDWESHVFGYGYGSGEEYIIPALQKVMETIPDKGPYNYNEIEDSVGKTIAWLFINILCKHRIFEYGTSPRHAWLSRCGKELKKYLHNKEFDDLKLFPDEDYAHCGPDYCNCGPNGYEEGRICQNPFWLEDIQTNA